MHSGVHPHEVRPPHGPRVALDVCKQQLLDHDMILLTDCVPQPPDSAPPRVVCHAGLASSTAVEGPPGPRWRPSICLRPQALCQASICVPPVDLTWLLQDYYRIT